MRKTVLSLVSVTALALAGCNAPSSQSSSSSDAPAAASAATTATAAAKEVSGTISLHEGSPVPSSKAILVLNLADVSSTAAGSAPLASKTAPAGTFPQPFQLTFKPDQVKAGDLYVVQASITDGERHYTMKIQAPVLSKDSKNDGIAIELVAEQTPAEKILADFDAVQKQLGGMKISHGTKLEADDSRGWQVFRQDGKVVFIRGEVDYGKKGYTSTDYAFKDGKPWAIVQQTKPSSDAKPTAIDRVGWSDDGTLVLKQHQVGDEVQPQDADVTAKLKTEAMEILHLATGGKDK